MQFFHNLKKNINCHFYSSVWAQIKQWGVCLIFGPVSNLTHDEQYGIRNSVYTHYKDYFLLFFLETHVLRRENFQAMCNLCPYQLTHSKR